MTIALLVVGLSCGPEELVDRDGPDPNDPRYAENASEVRFLALGDFGTGGPEQLAIAQAMCAHREEEPFHHVVTTGDNVYATGAIEDFPEDFFIPYSCLFDEDVRFHAVLGNHDDDTLEGEAQIAEPRFGMPARDYTWSLGPINFVMFDSQEVERELDGEQEFEEGSSYQWVLEEIENAQDAPWTVAVAHTPLYSAGELHGSEPQLIEAFAEPFADAGVDLYLAGHDHNYQSGAEDGVTYIVTGGGGAELYECVPDGPPQINTCMEEHHFVEIEATADAMTVTAITETAEVLETVDVPPNE